MRMEETNNREDFHDSIQSIIEEDEGVLSGWVLCYETVRQGDQRYLTVMTADATGQNTLPPWTAEGWLSYIVNSGIASSEAADDNEEDDPEDYLDQDEFE